MGPQAFDPQADNIDLIPNHYLFGGVSERPKEPVLKTGVVQATVGSNPTPSATQSTAKWASLRIAEILLTSPRVRLPGRHD